MAEAVSIVDIQVKDEQFKKFAALFATYKAQLDEMPGAWADGAKAQTAATMAQSKAMQEASAEEKKQQDAAKKKKMEEEARVKRWKELASTSVNFAKNIASATLNMGKWLALTGVASAAFGAFGLDRLAGGVADTRKESMGLGTSAGELKSASLYFGKALSDVSGSLDAIHEMQMDRSKWGGFSAMGINPVRASGMDTTELLAEMMTKARDIFTRSGGNANTAKAYHLTDFLSLQDLSVLMRMMDDEYKNMLRQQSANVRPLGLNDRTQQAWQTLSIQLDAAGEKIKNVFVDKLTPLVGPLTQLSVAITAALREVLSTDTIKKWISDLSGAVTKFANYLTSDDFKADIQSTFDALDDLAGAVYSFAQSIGKLFNQDGGQPLKGSDYRTINEIGKTDPSLAGALRQYYENKNGGLSDNENLGIVQQHLLYKHSDAIDALVKKLEAHNGAIPGTLSNAQRAMFEMVQDLRKYAQNAPYRNTIHSIFDPFNKNPALVNKLSASTGYGANQKLDMLSDATINKLAAAMVKMANPNANVAITVNNQTGNNISAQARGVAVAQ